MSFRTYARLSDADFGRPIERVCEFKYLGVVSVEHISWNPQVKYILSWAGKRLGMLGHIRGNLTSHCADSIYADYIRPIKDYCDTTTTTTTSSFLTLNIQITHHLHSRLLQSSLAARLFKDVPQKLFPKWLFVTKLWNIWSGRLWWLDGRAL